MNESVEMSPSQILENEMEENFQSLHHNKFFLKNQKEYFKKSIKHAFKYLKNHKKFMIGCTFVVGMSGALWPMYGILLANSIGALSKKDLNDVKKYSLYSALQFLGLAFYWGISLWMQNFFFMELEKY